MAMATIRVDIATLPEHLDRSRPSVVAEAIEAALREDGIKADCSDLFSHIKIDLPARSWPPPARCWSTCI